MASSSEIYHSEWSVKTVDGKVSPFAETKDNKKRDSNQQEFVTEQVCVDILDAAPGWNLISSSLAFGHEPSLSSTFTVSEDKKSTHHSKGTYSKGSSSAQFTHEGLPRDETPLDALFSEEDLRGSFACAGVDICVSTTTAVWLLRLTQTIYP